MIFVGVKTFRALFDLHADATQNSLFVFVFFFWRCGYPGKERKKERKKGKEGRKAETCHGFVGHLDGQLYD